MSRVYDGLGRLIRTIRPQAGGGERIEDHYYDGVRRIQTDVTPAVGDPATDRQYVYSPDYVDEFVAQIDAGDAQNPDGHAFYMLQDGNYNVVALVSASGAVVEQYAYRPYGGLVAVDSLGSAPVNTAGHQGLFYESLNGQGLAAGATGFYYNRNRFYSPSLGRFLQRDPNETAMPLLTALAMNGRTLMSLLGAFDALGHYRDGMNLYGYLGSNPVNGLDPSGQFSYGEVAGTTGLMGALFGGIMGAIMNPDDMLNGAARGALAGGLGGFAGGSAAFLASAYGLAGALMIGGFADGFVGGFAGSFLEGERDRGVLFIDALTCAGFGAVTGGLVEFGGAALRRLAARLPTFANRLKLARLKIPASWGDDVVTKRGVGSRWFDPGNGNNCVRIDKGNPKASYVSQRVDHVVVNHNGKVIGRNGQPIQGSIADDYLNAHIPLDEWLGWSEWFRP